MRTSTAITWLIVLIAAVLGVLMYFGAFDTVIPSQTATPTVTLTASPTLTPTTTDKSNLIRVTSPAVNALVKSPLTVTGQARGNWYFEADFPVLIYDANGRLLGQIPAQAQSDWMTTEFVPFRGTLTFDTPSTDTGRIVFAKSNASGLPEHDDQLVIPIRFDLTSVQKQTVRLYYYNSDKDKDSNGNILCSSQGLVSVQRQIPATITPIQDAIRLLLKGELTAAERSQGITTEYPLPGLELSAASLTNGVLTLTFNDPQNKTVGGSCRVGILWAQIEATAKQFPSVTSVRFMPEEIFQP